MKVTINSAVRCLDLSQRKRKLAVVDENGLCQVFNTSSGELLFQVCKKLLYILHSFYHFFQEPDINSVAWNTQYEDMLSFSGNETLAIKIVDFPSHQQKLHGFVVGLSGSKVFCLNGSNMNTFEMALSAPMYQYIDKKMFYEAHKIACLGIHFLAPYKIYSQILLFVGVTDGDWEELGFAALENLEFDVARLAFIKLQDYNYLELIRDLQVNFGNQNLWLHVN